MCPWPPPSLNLAVEDRQQVIQRLIYPPDVIDVASLDGVRVMAKVLVGQLPQPGQLEVDGGGAGEIGVDGVGLGVHRGVPWWVDDTSIHAPNDQEAKKKMMLTALGRRLGLSNQINYHVCDSNRLYANRTAFAGVLP